MREKLHRMKDSVQQKAAFEDRLSNNTGFLSGVLTW
jgi:hypothetical protein